VDRTYIECGFVVGSWDRVDHWMSRIDPKV